MSFKVKDGLVGKCLVGSELGRIGLIYIRYVQVKRLWTIFPSAYFLSFPGTRLPHASFSTNSCHSPPSIARHPSISIAMQQTVQELVPSSQVYICLSPSSFSTCFLSPTDLSTPPPSSSHLLTLPNRYRAPFSPPLIHRWCCTASGERIIDNCIIRGQGGRTFSTLASAVSSYSSWSTVRLAIGKESDIM